jgi:hypothetical protein
LERGLLRQLAAKAVAKRQQQVERQQREQKLLAPAPVAEGDGTGQVGMLQEQQQAAAAGAAHGSRPAGFAQPAAQLGKRKQAASSGGPAAQLGLAGSAKRRTKAAAAVAPVTQAGGLASSNAQPHAHSRAFKGAVLTSGVWTKQVPVSGLSGTCCLPVPGGWLRYLRRMRPPAVCMQQVLPDPQGMLC